VVEYTPVIVKIWQDGDSIIRDRAASPLAQKGELDAAELLARL